MIKQQTTGFKPVRFTYGLAFIRHVTNDPTLFEGPWDLKNNPKLAPRKLRIYCERIGEVLEDLDENQGLIIKG